MAGLSMKATCERCGDPLRPAGIAFICSYECTFCESCADVLGGTCPNCHGELVRRPRRAPSEPVDNSASA